MIAIIITVFAILFAISYVNLKNTILRNMVFIFLGFWGTTLVLSNFNPFNLYDVSNRTYFLLLLFVISFSAGALSSKSINQNETGFNSLNFSHLIEDIITNKLFLALIFVLDIVLLYLYIKERSILAYYSVAEMRVNLDELLYEGNSFLGLTRNMIILPITPIVTFLGTYLLMYNRKHYISLFLVLFFVLISALLGGSRGGILRIAIYCIFMIICKDVFSTKGHKKAIWPMLIKFIPILALVLIIMSNMTAQREFDLNGFSWEGTILGVESLSRHFVTYCVGPFRALDYSFQNEYLDIVGGYKFGGCTFGFIDGMLALILNKLGINYVASYKELASLLQDNWISIGGGESFNFAYTAALFHYIDLGILGVVLFPFIFGKIVTKITNKFILSCNPMLLVLLGYLFTIMIDTVFTWRLYRHQAFITFGFIACIYIWYKKNYLRRSRGV